MADPDRQFEAIAIQYAFNVFTISTFGACVYMAAVQSFLFKVNHSRQKVKSPTSLELTLVITVLWLFHRVLDNILGFIMDATILVIFPDEDLTEYYDLRKGSYSLKYWTGWQAEAPGWAGIILLLHEVLATWVIFQSAILLFQTGIPLFWDIWHGNHQYMRVKLQARAIELFNFTRRLYENRGTKFSSESDRGRKDGFWEDEKMDKNALNEMKETLGPPGGFGELGFNVSSDKICFGAMGIGSAFNLTFILEESPSESSKEENRRKSQ